MKMERQLDQSNSPVSCSQTNPLFDMSLNRTDFYSFQPDDLKPARPRRHWCLNVIVAFLILQTGLDAFLIYKVFTLMSLVSEPGAQRVVSNNIPQGGEEDRVTFNTLLQNNSQETRTLRSHLWTLQSQVQSLCGEEGQLVRMRSDLNRINTSTHYLGDKLSNISLTPGLPGPPGRDGPSGNPGSPGERGLKGDPGDAGRTGPMGVIGLKGQPGEPGVAGPPGPTGAQGSQGPGAKGGKGDTGLQGPQGSKGDSGIPGQKGSSGLTGIPGLTGQKGETGNPGTSGPPGPPGPSGPVGPPGPKGETGETEVKVRLVPGPSRGRVEVKHEGVWGTICDDNFDTVDAKVICRILGYDSVVTTFTAAAGSGPIWLDELNCRGTESDLFNCPHAGLGVNNCEHNEDAGAQCV